MTKPKKILITPSQRMDMRSLSNLTGVPEQYVTEAYTRSFIMGMKPWTLLQVTAAWLEAERDGIEFTPIFWHRTDDGVLHLTMWDMDKPRDDGIALQSASHVQWSNPNNPFKWGTQT